MSEDKDFAAQVLFTLLNRGCTNWSRTFLYHVVMELARKWVTLANTEAIRALAIELTEDQL